MPGEERDQRGLRELNSRLVFVLSKCLSGLIAGYFLAKSLLNGIYGRILRRCLCGMLAAAGSWEVAAAPTRPSVAPAAPGHPGLEMERLGQGPGCRHSSWEVARVWPGAPTNECVFICMQA